MGNLNRTFAIKGKPVTLIGQPLNVGDKAPSFVVVDQDFSEVRFDELKGKVRILSAVPSLDTAVCDRETRRFNEEAAQLSDDIEIVTISMDLPPAQKRWCGAAGIERVKVYSDHKEASFGKNYGILIQELRLLARCVFIVDREGIIRFIELVPEIAHEPNYEVILQEARSLI